MEKYISLNLWTLRLMGIWHPLEKASKFESKMSFFLRLSTLGSLLFILIPAGMWFYRLREDNLSETVEILALVMSAALVFLKVLNIFAKRDRVHSLLNKMSEFWQKSTKNELKSMHSFAKLGENVTKLYSMLGLVSIVTFIGQPFLYPNLISVNSSSSNFTIVNRLPFDGWDNFFDTCSKSSASSLFFVVVFIIHVIAGILASAASIGHDTIFAVLILHVCSNLRAITSSLREIQSIDWPENLEKNIVKCVKRYRDIIEYTKELENMLTVYLLAQTISSTLIICLTSFLVSRDISSNKEIFKYFSFWFTSLFQIFVFCWAANYLQTEADTVGRSAYDVYGKLMNLNSKNPHDDHDRDHDSYVLLQQQLLRKKMPIYLQMIIMRSQKPPKITAGNFYVLSLENYKNILSTSYSYFTILRAFAVDNKA